MDNSEFTFDYGITDASLIDFDEVPHKINKKAFILKLQKTGDGTSLLKGRFDFNLFKLSRDNPSQNYAVCVEIYFRSSQFYEKEFNSVKIGFEKLSMHVNHSATKKVDSDYKYYRSIINMSPDGGGEIQRRLFGDFQADYENSSPSSLPIYAVIYGLKDNTSHDIDISIYDFDKAFEISSDEKFTMHTPIDLRTFALIVCAQRNCASNATVICHALLQALVKPLQKPWTISLAQRWIREDRDQSELIKNI